MYPVAFSLPSSTPPYPPIFHPLHPTGSVFSLGAPECRQVISPLFLGHNEARVFGSPLPTAHRAWGLGGRTRWHVQCVAGRHNRWGTGPGAWGLVCSCFSKECAEAHALMVPTQCLHFFPRQRHLPCERAAEPGAQAGALAPAMALFPTLRLVTWS